MSRKDVTIDVVAAHAGVSLATVSRVLNGMPKVSAKTQEKVLAAIKDLGYRPNYFSRALASNKSNSIGMAIPALSGYFFGELMTVIENRLRKANQQLIITNNGGSRDSELQSINFLASRGCETIILYSSHMSEEDLLNIEDSGIELVLLNRKTALLNRNGLFIDFAGGTRLAVEHLLELGHREIAFITGPRTEPLVQSRIQSYYDTLNDAGIAVKSDLLVECGFRPRNASKATEELLSRHTPFTAILYFNDEMAITGLGVLIKAGLKVPDDIAIVGYDNHWLSQYTTPTLTTLHVPAEKLANNAAEIALALVMKEPVDKSLSSTVKIELIKRQSTGKPPRKRFNLHLPIFSTR